jgi:hypothetical protein
MVRAAERLEQLFSRKEEKPNFSLEEVRKVLAAKSRVSRENTDAIRNLLLSHGAEKLSQVDPKEYETLLTEVKELPDAK